MDAILKSYEFSPGNYTMSFWHSTTNPQTINKARLLAQSMWLSNALQTQLSKWEIALPSRDQDENKKGIEIAVWYKTGTRSSFLDVTAFLTNKANELNLDYTNFVENSEGMTRDFSSDELTNIDAFNVQRTLSNVTEKDIQSMLDTGVGAPPDVPGIPANQISEPIAITNSRVQSIRGATGDAIRETILGIMDGASAGVKATKSAWGTIIWIAGGVLTFIGVATRLGTIIEFALVGVELCSLIAALFGTAAVIGPIAILIAAIAALVGTTTPPHFIGWKLIDTRHCISTPKRRQKCSLSGEQHRQ